MNANEAEILSALANKDYSAGLSLGDIEGRKLVEHIKVRQPIPAGSVLHEHSSINVTIGRTEFNQCVWRDLHFQKCVFEWAAFDEVSMSNCLFDRCNFKHSGFWRSTVNDCQFIRCDFRHAAFGGIDYTAKNKHPNAYTDVQFEKCDLRWSSHSCEKFSNCFFSQCRLSHVDFSGAVFANSKFEGKLDVVRFMANDGICLEMPPNRLENCDFRRAELVDCQFIKLSLYPAIFPTTDDWIILPRGPDDLRVWREHIGKPNIVIDSEIENVGAPTLMSRSWLKGAQFTNEQIAILEQIAAR